MAWRPVGLIAAAVTALLLATSNGYGYHRDELYFRLLGRHLQWGYVDQPPFTPLLTRLSIDVFGDHLWSIRVPSALIIGGVALLAAAIAREFGGGAGAQSLAAFGAAGTFPLIGGHVIATATPDLPVWLGVLLFVLRALLRGQSKAWLGAGLIAGLGLYNKHLVLLLLLCLAVAVLLVGPRSIFADRWLWLGLGLGLLVGLPNLLYQVFNDFPQLKMASALAADKGADARTQMLPFQLVLLGVGMVPIWVAGLVAAWRRTRAVALAYPLMIVLLLVIAGQPYYSMGLLLGLYAIGAVPAARWVAARRTNGRKVALGAALAINLAFSVVFALPVIPADRLAATGIADINQVTADQIGWPEYVRQVTAAVDGLSPADRARAVLFTGNYGEAGALDRFGVGLPPIFSAQNELYNYGPPPDARTVAVVVLEASPAEVAARFGPCELSTRLHNRAGVPNEEVEAGVFVCRDLPAPWSALWPSLRHYD
jgi:4-amino-4-deoxy-L-arabinose transferase-like glycosyltransferase